MYLSFCIYIIGTLTEKTYDKPMKRNVVYNSIITLSHATSHEVKWHQNKPWYSTICLDVVDVMTSMTLSERCSAVSAKTACKCFPASILAL